MQLRTTAPVTRICDDLEFTRDQWRILLAHESRFQDQTHRDDGIDSQLQDECTTFQTQYLARAFVYVITETMMQYPWIYVTEKTWKAMLAPAPFLLLGTAHTLAWLKDQGFQTFDRWWDESYDYLPRAADRVQAVVQQLQMLSNLDATVLNRMREEMLPVLQHNLANLRDLRGRELAKIQSML